VTNDQSSSRDLLLVRLQLRQAFTLNTMLMLDRFMKEWKLSAFAAIVECRVLSETRLANLIAEEFGYRFAESVDRSKFEPSTLSSVPYRFAREHSVLALHPDADRVTCYFADPSDTKIVAKVEKYLGQSAAVIVTPKTDIQMAVSELYSPHLQLDG
jgi:hypothetical protein